MQTPPFNRTPQIGDFFSTCKSGLIQYFKIIDIGDALIFTLSECNSKGYKSAYAQQIRRTLPELQTNFKYIKALK